MYEVPISDTLLPILLKSVSSKITASFNATLVIIIILIAPTVSKLGSSQNHTYLPTKHILRLVLLL